MRVPCLGVLAGSLLLAAACSSSSGPATLTGVIRKNGGPLHGGTIAFVSAADASKRSKFPIRPDGRYLADNLPPGELKVAIETESVRGVVDRVAPEAHRSPAGYVAIDRRYADPDKSGLSAIAKPGEQTKDFDVE